jgi:hypothetical protein
MQQFAAETVEEASEGRQRKGFRVDLRKIEAPQRMQMLQRGIDLGDLATGQHVHAFGAVVDLRSIPDAARFRRCKLDRHRVFSLDLRCDDSTIPRLLIVVCGAMSALDDLRAELTQAELRDCVGLLVSCAGQRRIRRAGCG